MTARDLPPVALRLSRKAGGGGALFRFSPINLDDVIRSLSGKLEGQLWCALAGVPILRVPALDPAR